MPLTSCRSWREMGSQTVSSNRVGVVDRAPGRMSRSTGGLREHFGCVGAAGRPDLPRRPGHRRTTPAVLESVRTGTHEVRVELEGYEPQAQTVRVTRGKTVTVSFSWLEPDPPDEEPPPVPTYARVSGYVSENLAGRRRPGAMVTAYEAGTKKAVASAE